MNILPTPTPTPAPGGTVLRSANFQGASGYTTTGSAAIVLQSGRHRLELSSDFSTTPTGALEVRLCGGTSCGGSSLNVGRLQSASGAQFYNLPNAGGQYSHVVIWCAPISVPFGHGQLR